MCKVITTLTLVIFCCNLGTLVYTSADTCDWLTHQLILPAFNAYSNPIVVCSYVVPCHLNGPGGVCIAIIVISMSFQHCTPSYKNWERAPPPGQTTKGLEYALRTGSTNEYDNQKSMSQNTPRQKLFFPLCEVNHPWLPVLGLSLW